MPKAMERKLKTEAKKKDLRAKERMLTFMEHLGGPVGNQKEKND
jgi:hypothetical protein